MVAENILFTLVAVLEVESFVQEKQLYSLYLKALASLTRYRDLGRKIYWEHGNSMGAAELVLRHWEASLQF